MGAEEPEGAGAALAEAVDSTRAHGKLDHDSSDLEIVPKKRCRPNAVTWADAKAGEDMRTFKDRFEGTLVLSSYSVPIQFLFQFLFQFLYGFF